MLDLSSSADPKPNLKIAVLVSGNMLPDHPQRRADFFELDEQMAKITPAFADHGMDVSLVDWREIASIASEFDAVLPLFAWDYFEGNQRQFIEEMAQVARQTKLFNRFKTLQWNAEKSYLSELAAQGAPTIPSVHMDTVSEGRVLNAMETLGADMAVIKPNIGGGAWKQVLYKAGDPFPARDDLPPSGAVVQPFLPKVKEEGELSFVYFADVFSHAILKRAKAGDYRVQSIYGGSEEAYTPPREERAQARGILDVLDFTPLYARVDMLRGDDGRLLLIELELIEPYLYLSCADGEGKANKGAQKLAKALLRAIAKPGN